MQRQHLHVRLAWVLPLLLVVCCGCPFSTEDLPGGSTSQSLDVGQNGSLATATALSLSAADAELEFSGTIDSGADIDVYNLGLLAAGDHLYVDVSRRSGNLDATAAIFDSEETLIAFSDDRTPDGSNLNPQFDFTICGETGEYFLGIISYPGYTSAGEYEVVVRIQRDVGIPTPNGQIVFLDWRGGSDIVIPNVGVYTLRPFSAADLGLSADRTAAAKDRIQTLVEQTYAGYNLTVLNSDDSPVPSGAHSTIYFGGSDAEAFAISEKIDPYNEDPSDDAIIFTESFDAIFSSTSFDEMTQAVANTVAHELGHLLGLVHTADCNSLMDTTCYNARLLHPQSFTTAKLDTSVFPFGWQDAPELLTWILGLVGF